MQYLHDYIQAEEQVTNIEHEKLYLEVQLKKRKEPPEIVKTSTYIFAGIATTLLLAIFTIPVLPILFWLTPLDDFLLNLFSSIPFVVNHPYITLLILAYFIPAILLFPFSYFICTQRTTNGLTNEEAIEQYQKGLSQIPDLERKLQHIPAEMQSAQARVQRLRNMNIAHSKYLPYSRTLLSYLEEGRADTLKEAINLLVYERREDVRNDELERHYREMERQVAEQNATLADIQDEVTRSANAAEEAAAWGGGAATTIIAASEAARQRKKDRE